MDEIQLCRNCGLEYTERENLGKWHCWFHPAPFNSEQDGYNYARDQYDCCGRMRTRGTLSARGCVRTHHNASPNDYTEQDTLLFSITDIEKQGIKLDRESFEFDHFDNTVKVFRYDCIHAASASEFGAPRAMSSVCLNNNTTSLSSSSERVYTPTVTHYKSPVPVRNPVNRFT